MRMTARAASSMVVNPLMPLSFLAGLILLSLILLGLIIKHSSIGFNSGSG